jgi:hypothetical protein
MAKIQVDSLHCHQGIGLLPDHQHGVVDDLFHQRHVARHAVQETRQPRKIRAIQHLKGEPVPAAYPQQQSTSSTRRTRPSSCLFACIFSLVP